MYLSLSHAVRRILTRLQPSDLLGTGSILPFVQQRCPIRIPRSSGNDIDLEAMVGRGTDDNQFQSTERNILLTGHARDQRSSKQCSLCLGLSSKVHL
jgi:hypothetical protein